MSKFFSKKIPTILGFLLLVGAGIFLAVKQQFFGLQKKTKITSIPKEIHISNVQHDQFAVSWITEENSIGFIKYGVDISLENKEVDDRDQRSGDIGKYKIHYVTLKNLEPEKTYFFKIGIGESEKNTLFDNNGESYNIITAPVLDFHEETKILSGKILRQDDVPASDSIVYVNAVNIAPLSALTDKNGRWLIFLNKSRIKDLSEYAVFDLEAGILKIKAQDGSQEASASILTKYAFPAVPDIILGKGPYDFKDGKIPDQMIVDISNVVTIDNPAEAEERINTFQPEFQGKGPANMVLTIKIEQQEPYTASVTVDEDGNWSFTPPFDLSPGSHKISISYIAENGETETINRNFVILAAGESDLPAITATSSGKQASPSPTPTPSPSTSVKPSISPSPTSLGRVSMPSTDQDMPATGISWPTILIFLTGLLMVMFSFIFPLT